MCACVCVCVYVCVCVCVCVTDVADLNSSHHDFLHFGIKYGTFSKHKPKRKTFKYSTAMWTKTKVSNNYNNASRARRILSSTGSLMHNTVNPPSSHSIRGKHYLHVSPYSITGHRQSAHPYPPLNPPQPPLSSEYSHANISLG